MLCFFSRKAIYFEPGFRKCLPPVFLQAQKQPLGCPLVTSGYSWHSSLLCVSRCFHSALLMCPVYLCTFQLFSPPGTSRTSQPPSVLAELGTGLWAVGLPCPCLDHQQNELIRASFWRMGGRLCEWLPQAMKSEILSLQRFSSLLLVSVFFGGELPGCRRPSGSLVVPARVEACSGRGGCWKEFVGVWGKNWQIGLMSWPNGDSSQAFLLGFWVESDTISRILQTWMEIQLHWGELLWVQWDMFMWTFRVSQLALCSLMLVF